MLNDKRNTKICKKSTRLGDDDALRVSLETCIFLFNICLQWHKFRRLVNVDSCNVIKRFTIKFMFFLYVQQKVDTLH